MFTSVCKDVYKKGKGAVEHKTVIEQDDLAKLYGSFVFSTKTPSGLQNKVWFEIILHFCRRGRENQRQLTPSMFTIKTDEKNLRYVCQVESEISKNHQGTSHVEDKNVRMYETGGALCPVASFELFLSKRNPNCSALFQSPCDSFCDDDSSWYENKPLGKNKLGNMMQDISKSAKLTRIYTNHCIRATTITALSYAGFEARHIMTVSGHRNEASVKSYVRDTTSDQKRQMSVALSKLVPSSSSTGSSTATDDHREQEIYEPFNDDMDDLLCLSSSQTERVLQEITDYENRTEIQTGNYHVQAMQNHNVQYAPGNSFVFNNCTVNIHQHN